MQVDIYIGDALQALRAIDSESVQACITSPPYWGQRDYGVDGQYGLEETLDAHLDKMVEVFEEVRRILKPSGTLWLNYGDSYASARNGRDASENTKDDRTWRNKPLNTIGGKLKSKDLGMIPNRLAIRMQDAGWYVRSEIIWFKPNPMPESVTDRPAVAHEKIWLMTKSPVYYYDAEAVRQGIKTGVSVPSNEELAARPERPKNRGHTQEHAGMRSKWDKMTAAEQAAAGSNLKNVWMIATHAYKGEHIATFPPDLVINCVKAGTAPGDLILDPFGGAGTVGLVASGLGRKARLIELKQEYAELAANRINRSEAGQSSCLEIARLWHCDV